MKAFAFKTTYLKVVTIGFVCLCSACFDNEGSGDLSNSTTSLSDYQTEILFIKDDVSLANYFYFMDSILAEVNNIAMHEINEYILVHANPWIIDSLAATDYYLLKDRGIIARDILSLIVLKKGMELRIPDLKETQELQSKLTNLSLDLNIPEYKLRVYEKDSLLYEFLVRVGQDERKFLAMAQHFVDLKTKTGEGKIIRIVKNASFINPVNNHAYHVTKRDDNIITTLPNIPWLEPEIDGIRHGQLLHPTTNVRTLGKAYSNGCVGLRESDSWILYYHAPLDTKIISRYDLDLPDQKLKDIYNRRKK